MHFKFRASTFERVVGHFQNDSGVKILEIGVGGQNKNVGVQKVVGGQNREMVGGDRKR